MTRQKREKEIKVTVEFASGSKEKLSEAVVKFFEKFPDAGKEKKEAS